MSSKVSRPAAIQALIPEDDPTDPSKHRCEGAEFHSPRPLKVQGYRLPSGRSFWLCGTCRDNVDVYVSLWERYKGLPWSVQRCFGNNARNVANLILQGRMVTNHRKEL